MRKFTYTLLILFISSIALVAQETNDKEMIAKTLSDLETAIVENDSKKAGEILHDDVTILEGGGMETKSQYLSHHFHSDGKVFISNEQGRSISGN